MTFTGNLKNKSFIINVLIIMAMQARDRVTNLKTRIKGSEEVYFLKSKLNHYLDLAQIVPNMNHVEKQI